MEEAQEGHARVAALVVEPQRSGHGPVVVLLYTARLSEAALVMQHLTVSVLRC